MDMKKNLVIYIRRSIKISKKKDKIFGEDEIKKTKNILIL